MEELLKQGLFLILSALVGIVGFFLTRKFSSDDRKDEKIAMKNEQLKEEIMGIKIAVEKMTVTMATIQNEMHEIKNDARQAVFLGRNIGDMKDEITRIRSSVDAAWKWIEKFRETKDNNGQ